jgi:replication-associated recombination protein RarA
MDAPKGQDHILDALKQHLPRVVLLDGPQGTGKSTIAEYLAQFHGFEDSDVLKSYMGLSGGRARTIERFTQTAPMGFDKLVIVDISQASETSLNSLLKTIEETAVYFILLTSVPVLATVVSRAVSYNVHYLSSEDIAGILVEKKNFSSAAATVIAERARGQVSNAFLHQKTNDLKPAIAVVLKAFRELDPAVLERVSGVWTEEHTTLMLKWCEEFLAGRWRIFSEAESGIEDRRIPMRIMMGLNRDIRPKLVVRSSLMKVLRGLM